jgi:hypothetical protein
MALVSFAQRKSRVVARGCRSHATHAMRGELTQFLLARHRWSDFRSHSLAAEWSVVRRRDTLMDFS